MNLMAISDTELLAVVDDLADENGWTNSVDVRSQLGDDPEAISGIGSRLAWMRRYGWLERQPDTGLWRLTAMGHAILDNPQLSGAVQSAMERLNPAQRLRLAREISQRAQQGPDEIYNALRREWHRSIRR